MTKRPFRVSPYYQFLLIFLILVLNIVNANSSHLPQFPDNLYIKPKYFSEGEAYISQIDNFETEIYVSVDGDDENLGSLEQPIKSFKRARDLVREHLDGQGHIAVYFRNGFYNFDQTINLNSKDSGNKNQIIVYKAFEGEKPVFTSLKKIDNWQYFQNNIYKAPLPKGINHIRFLYDKKSDWLPRSATKLFLTNEKSQIDESCLQCNWDNEEAQEARFNVKYPNDYQIPNFEYGNQYDLRQSTISQTQEILPISYIDIADLRIYTQIPASLEMRLNFEEAKNLNRNWILNSLEGIDEKGEWAVLNGEIYLHPKIDLDEIYAPMLTQLIHIDNDSSEKENPISYIRFEGITFSGGDFYVMNENDITTQHDWSVVNSPTALIGLKNVSNIVINNCAFEKSGSTALRFDNFAQNNIVRNNHFSYLGREAIVFSGLGPGYGDVNKFNDISYNQITNIGMEKWAAPAIMVNQSSNNHIHHNYIHNIKFSAITLTAPKQRVFVSRYKDNDHYLGRESQYYDISSSLINKISKEADELLAGYEAMNYIYNYNNIVELNGFIDIGSNTDHLMNGYIYNSSIKRGEANFINYNYIHDSKNHLINNPAFYSDSDQDYSSYIGNIISGVKNDDMQYESMPLFLLFALYPEGDFNYGSNIAALGNLIIDSSYNELVDGENYLMAGTILDKESADADKEEAKSDKNKDYLEIYKTMLYILKNNAAFNSVSIKKREDMIEILNERISF